VFLLTNAPFGEQWTQLICLSWANTLFKQAEVFQDFKNLSSDTENAKTSTGLQATDVTEAKCPLKIITGSGESSFQKITLLSYRRNFHFPVNLCIQRV